MNNLVSVIVPAYNHENYVQETIKSIINQTYQNIELIVIDDGSKDSTWEKIQEMQEECEKRFVNIHFETKENEGTCRTINKMISLAKGEYIYSIASDDVAKPDAIKIEIEFLDNNLDYTLVVGNSEFIDAGGKKCYKDKKGNLVYDIKKAKFKTFKEQHGYRNSKFLEHNFGRYETLYLGNYVPNGSLIRKSIFEKVGLFTPEAPLEDWWLLLQISKYSKMKYIDKILFSYRWHGKNTMANLSRMNEMTKKTFEYELNSLSKGNFKDGILINPENILKNGVCYKRVGIPFIFEIQSFKVGFKKVKKIKLFGVKIAECVK